MDFNYLKSNIILGNVDDQLAYHKGMYQIYRS